MIERVVDGDVGSALPDCDDQLDFMVEVRRLGRIRNGRPVVQTVSAGFMKKNGGSRSGSRRDVDPSTIPLPPDVPVPEIGKHMKCSACGSRKIDSRPELYPGGIEAQRGRRRRGCGALGDDAQTFLTGVSTPISRLSKGRCYWVIDNAAPGV